MWVIVNINNKYFWLFIIYRCGKYIGVVNEWIVYVIFFEENDLEDFKR